MMKFLVAFLALGLAACETTKEVEVRTLCTAAMQVSPVEEPKPPETAQFNESGLAWFLGSYQPAYKQNYSQIKQINESCK